MADQPSKRTGQPPARQQNTPARPGGNGQPHQSQPATNAGRQGQNAPSRSGSGGGGDSQPSKQLAIPSAAAGDPAAFELLRVWVAEQSQQITLRPGIWQDPSTWGTMLADLARSIVKVHEENDEDLDSEAFLAAVLEGFDTEIEAVLDEFGDGDPDETEEPAQ